MAMIVPPALSHTGTPIAAEVRAADERRHAVVRTLLRSGTGSVGAVLLVPGYDTCVSQVGSSPAIVDRRASPAVASAPAATASRTYREVVALPVADQARELLAALSLNKSQLAEVLRVSRPTLYDWLDGKEPSAANVERITALLRMLARAGVSSTSPLNARFVRHAVTELDPSLLEALCAEHLDEALVSRLVADARALDSAAQSRLRGREDRLRALGYDEPSEDDAKAQLANNLAMREWPKR